MRSSMIARITGEEFRVISLSQRLSRITQSKALIVCFSVKTVSCILFERFIRRVFMAGHESDCGIAYFSITAFQRILIQMRTCCKIACIWSIARKLHYFYMHKYNCFKTYITTHEYVNYKINNLTSYL